MRRSPFPLLRSTIALVAMCHMTPASALAQAPANEVIDHLQRAIRYEVAAKRLPAFSIALVDGDRLVWAEGFGFQDAAQTVPATADSVYRVGSVSKLFTDLAVMQLVEQQKLALDEPISTYLPDFKPHSEFDVPITLGQLMSHRAGLVRESPVGNYFDPDEPSLAATVASLNETALVYKPDTRTKYSNAGIAVVGQVVETKAGVPFTRHLDEAIFKPLAMSESGFELTPALEKNLATGYMWTYDDRRFVAPTFALGTAPAGNLYSSVRDLAKFLSCLFDEGRSPGGAIVSPHTLKQMISPLPEADGKPQGFGIGFQIQELDGLRKVGHGGAVYGYSTQLAALPERKLGVAAVAALDGANGVVGRLVDYALRLSLAEKDGRPLPDFVTTAAVAPERAKKLVGVYRGPEGFARVDELNGRVFVLRGDFRREIRAAAADAALVIDDSFGLGDAVSLDGDGRLTIGKSTFERQPDAAPPAPPERWLGLIGEYGWDHNTLYILEDQGQLVALIEWFYTYPLTELAENEFAFPDHGLYHGEKLIFTRDAAGNATKVVAAEVPFVRREVGTKEGVTFKIKPLRPIEELRQAALDATPPAETGDFRETDLVEPSKLDDSIKHDIRYASDNNFTGSVFYKQARAFMQRPAAEAVVRAHKRLEPRGLGILIHDAYRPWHVTKMFWDATPDAMKDFVANPANGSRHNRGCAVDLTLYDRATGQPIPMVAGYDEFSARSFPMYPGGTSRQRWYRELLRSTMEAEGFTVYDFEWWHFDYRDWQKYRIGDATFEDLDAATK